MQSVQSQCQPKLDILPPDQLKVWPQLKSTPKDFVLYGGTAIALRLGHRKSIDFDFFSNRSFKPDDLYRSIPYLKDSEVIQRGESTLTCLVQQPNMQIPVKVSFFGGLPQKTLLPADVVSSNQLQIAAMHDLFGMKCATIADRVAYKDYVDIHAILQKTELTLTDGVAAAKAIYGKQYHPLTTMKALSYFKGGDLAKLDSQTKNNLLKSVRTTDLKQIKKLQTLGVIGKQNLEGISSPQKSHDKGFSL